MKMWFKRTVVFALCLHLVVGSSGPALILAAAMPASTGSAGLFSQDAIVPCLILAGHRAIDIQPVIFRLAHHAWSSWALTVSQAHHAAIWIGSTNPENWHMGGILSSLTFLVGAVLQRENPLLSVIDTTSLTPKQELRVLKRFSKQLLKELAGKGQGHMPALAIFSDQHGAIKKFDVFILDAITQVLPKGTFPEEFRLDPNRPLDEQLQPYHVTLRSLQGKLFFHNLGDFMDRGPDGIKIFLRSIELIDNGLSDFVIGNHDFLEFKNLFRFHLPWYEWFSFHGYIDRHGNVQENWTARRNDPYSQEVRRSEWWEMLLAQHRAEKKDRQLYDWNRFDLEVNGEMDAAKKKRKAGSGLYAQVSAAPMNPSEQKLWNKFRGNNAYGAEIYTGVRSVDVMSVKWWEELLSEFEYAYDVSGRSRSPEAPATKAWLRAMAIMEEIIGTLNAEYDEGMARGEWWLQVFEAINHENYTSPEWYAMDWIFHPGWGTSVLKELNAMLKPGEAPVTTSNYLENETLKRIAHFYRNHFSLYQRDIYQNVYMHAWLPVNASGEFYFTYQDQQYRGRGSESVKSVWEGLDRIASDIRNPKNGPWELQEAFTLINRWYADNTTSAKAIDLARAIAIHGEEHIMRANGIKGHLMTGHIPFYQFATTLTPSERGIIAHHRTGQTILTDHGMGEKFGDRGAYVFVSRDGVRLRGYRSKESSTIEWDPPTASGEEIFFENPPLSRGDYLPRLIEIVHQRIAELETPRPVVKGKIRLAFYPRFVKPFRKAA